MYLPFLLVIVFFSVVCHEISHGLVAYRLGDPTAYRAGRLTFNPLPHIDIFGTIILPLFLVLSGSSFIFAWAKPVPVNSSYFRNPRDGMMYVAMAGPGTNLALALVLALAAHMGAGFLPGWLLGTLAMASLINIILMAFNLDTPWFTPFIILSILSVAISMPGAPGFVGQFHIAVVAALLITLPSIAVDKAKAVSIVAHLMNLLPIAVAGIYCLYREQFGLLELRRESEEVEEELEPEEA